MQSTKPNSLLLRLRLWSMRARLDGNPIHQLTVSTMANCMVGLAYILIDPSGWHRHLIIAVGMVPIGWLILRGWRTPSIDKALKAKK